MANPVADHTGAASDAVGQAVIAASADMPKRSDLSTTPATSARMSRQRERDTGIEVALRRELHRMGLRFRIHLRPLKGVRRQADVVFTRRRVAVFVDGCFWHGCPQHGTWPRSNQQFWRDKIEGNRRRDIDTNARLNAEGWTTVRVWEHEDPVSAAHRIAALIKDRDGHDRAGPYGNPAKLT